MWSLMPPAAGGVSQTCVGPGLQQGAAVTHETLMSLRSLLHSAAAAGLQATTVPRLARRTRSQRSD